MHPSVAMRTAPETAVLQRASTAVFAVFALNGAGFATWAGRLPETRRELGLDPQQLGLVLLALAVGSLLSLPFGGRLADRFGVERAVTGSAMACLVGYVGAGLAAGALHSVPLVVVALFVSGAGMGVWDVAMNLEGARVEKGLGRSIMPRYHAAFSGGTVLLALVAAGASAAGVPIEVHLVVVPLLLLAGVAWAARGFVERPDATASPDAGTSDTTTAPAVTPPVAPAERNAWLEPRTLLIGVIVLIAAFTEGTANDWLSIAFVDGHHVPAWAGVLAFAVFLSCMTAGRLAGTALLDRYGRVAVLRVMLSASIVGCLTVVFGPTWLAYPGAALWGVGVALGFPVGMSAAADDPRRASARMSVVSTIAYTAFLAGPALLGFLGHRVGVLHALLAVGVLLLVALALLPALQEEGDPHPSHVTDA